MHRILGNIFVSSIDALSNGDIEANKITHVLSLLPGPLSLPPQISEEKGTHLQIAVTDEPSTNLLGILPAAFDFINLCLYGTAESTQINVKDRHKNTLLVHCHEGLSRAPSVLICYLIKYYRLTLAQSIHAIKRKTGEVNINEGFMSQLQLFESIKGDLNDDRYKQFLITFNGDDVRSTLQQLNEHKSASPDTQPAQESGFIRCKICREPLAKSSQILQHTKPDESSQQSSFNKKSGNYVYARLKASDKCSHYFLQDPLKWMNLTDDLEGKLSCGKCHAKIGGYSWKGSRCSCGKWIVPSFHLQVSKADFVRLKDQKPEESTA